MPRPLQAARPALLAAAAATALAACGGDPTPPRNGTLSACPATDTTGRLALAVGQVRILTGPALNCVRLDGQASGGQYLAVVGNTSPVLNQSGGYRLNYDFENPLAAVSADLVRLRGDVTAGPRRRDVHERLMAAARTLDLASAREEWARRRSGLASGVRGAIFPSGVSPQVGTAAQIRVPGLDDGDNACEVFTTITATVRYISNRAIIMTDNASPANGFAAEDFEAIGAEFDNLIYPTDIAYFGTGSDVDDNDRIVILYTPEVNKATPRTQPGQQPAGVLAGFFWAGDLFPRTGTNACGQSNQSELFYLLVPDPTGIHSDARAVDDVREKTRGTIAHEFQHMLNAGWRLTRAPAFEDVWLDEALAHFAEEAVGRAKLGVGDFAELTHAQVVANRSDYDAFFYQNMARMREWLQSPAQAAPIDSTANVSLAVRGAAWGLLRYAIDHYAGNDAKAFTRELANSTAAGVTNFRNAIGTGVPLDTVLTGFQAAVYADNLPIPNLPARFQFRSWNLRDGVAAVSSGNYPLAVATLGGDGTASGSVRSGGGASYYRFSIPADGATSLQVAAGAGTEVGFTGAKLIVMRLQ